MCVCVCVKCGKVDKSENCQQIKNDISSLFEKTSSEWLFR